MTKQNQAVPTPIPEAQDLRDAVQLIDCISQSVLPQIVSIAKLAFSYLEIPENRKDIDNVLSALQAIWEKAEELECSINNEAEEVGCNYVDKAWRRRLEAESAYRMEAK
ncbi:hypothetical protein [Nitrosomonas sp. Nm34]|uniref:hypothetical protein n=1 Tax=Nitrosomonas sp. Nm34 TaxID=1881055 RepID=UPI0008F223C5|nr:hypothetical protein [Nitrosomonas sp. Nm34]SFI96281.1 hypothetical protein SAMN05428978_10682 [Nitrosomonas sp. Nm34]